MLEAARQVTGHFPLIFPSERNPFKPMSENTLRALLIRGGYGGGHVPRGFGAAFRTIMNERAERRWRETGRSGVSTDRAIIAVPFRFAVGSMPVKQAENAFYVDQAGPPVR